MKRERVERQLLLEAERINEIDTLAKGYTLKYIMQTQRFVSIEQIKAISKASDISHIDGEILEQLVSLAKVNIKLRKNTNSNFSSVESIKGNIITKS